MERSYGIIAVKKSATAKVLVIQHTSDRSWGFPKGRAEEGEEPDKAALRELKEETGLSLTRDNLAVSGCKRFESSYFNPVTGKQKQVLLRLAVVLEEETGSVETGDVREILKVEWVPVENLEEKVTYKEDKGIAVEVKEWIADMA